MKIKICLIYFPPDEVKLSCQSKLSLAVFTFEHVSIQRELLITQEVELPFISFSIHFYLQELWKKLLSLRNNNFLKNVKYIKKLNIKFYP